MPKLSACEQLTAGDLFYLVIILVLIFIGMHLRRDRDYWRNRSIQAASINRSLLGHLGSSNDNAPSRRHTLQ